MLPIHPEGYFKISILVKWVTDYLADVNYITENKYDKVISIYT
jgi:hypothetical protein